MNQKQDIVVPLQFLEQSPQVDVVAEYFLEWLQGRYPWVFHETGDEAWSNLLNFFCANKGDQHPRQALFRLANDQSALPCFRARAILVLALPLREESAFQLKMGDWGDWCYDGSAFKANPQDADIGIRVSDLSDDLRRFVVDVVSQFASLCGAVYSCVSSHFEALILHVCLHDISTLISYDMSEGDRLRLCESMPLWEHNGHVHVEDIWKTDSGWNVLMSRKFQALITSDLLRMEVEKMASMDDIPLRFVQLLHQYSSLAIEPLLSDTTLKASLVSSVMSALVMDRVNFLLSLPSVVIERLFNQLILSGHAMEMLWYLLGVDNADYDHWVALNQCKELMVRTLAKHLPGDDSISRRFMSDLEDSYQRSGYFSVEWQRLQWLRILQKEENERIGIEADRALRQEELRQENELNKKLTQILDSMRISLSD